MLEFSLNSLISLLQIILKDKRGVAESITFKRECTKIFSSFQIYVVCPESKFPIFFPHHLTVRMLWKSGEIFCLEMWQHWIFGWLLHPNEQGE